MSKSNIMVVEDSGIVLLDIQKSLKALGYSVTATASSRDEAIQKANETRPDLVLMDIRLGEEMGGIEAADYIREHFNIPIVFLTGYADEDTFQRAKITDPVGYILKPFDPKSLRTTIEIALHNHELKSKLHESEKRYRTLIETMNDGVEQVDAEGKIIFVNDKFCQMTGLTRNELIGREHTSLFVKEERELQREEFENRKAGKVNTIETALARKDGTSIPVILSGSPVFNHQGFISSIGVFTDISDRKQSEQALQASEEKYRKLFSEMSAGCALHEIICDEDGNVIDYLTLEVNAAFERILDVKSEDVVGKKASETLPEAELRYWLGIFGKVALVGESANYEMFSPLNKKYFEGSAYCPESGKFAVTFLDVTERKQAEEEVWKSKQALEEAERQVHLGHYEIETLTGNAIWSEEIYNIFGLDPKDGEPTVETYTDLIHPDDQEKVYVLYNESAQKGIPFDLVYRIIRMDGEIRYVHSNARVMEDETGGPKLFGTFQDITELKQTEIALRESELLYHDLVETAQDLIWQCDREGRYIYLNPAWEDVFGYKVKDMLGKSFAEFQSPAFANQDREMFKKILEGSTVKGYETLHLGKDGRQIHLVFNAKVVRDELGNVVGTRGTAYDITDRKRAEDALVKSENLLLESQKIAHMGHYTLDFLSGIWESSDGLNELFDIDRDYKSDVEGWLQIVHPDDREAMATYLAEEVLNKRQNFDKEYRVVRVHDGETRWVRGLGRLEFDDEGKPIRMIGNIQDITERKQADMALKESADRYRAVVESQTEFIVRWKPDGTRTFVNEAYLRYYNISLEEALTSSFMSLIVEEDRLAVEQKMIRLVSGETESETDIHRVIKPDGSFGWQEWTDHALYDEQGNIFEFQSVGRDITERKLAEEALQAKTAELEALFSISAHLRTAQSAEAMLPLVLTETCRVLSSDANAIILYNPDEERFLYALSDGALAVNNGVKFEVENSISGLVLQTGLPYTTEDLSMDPNKTSALLGEGNLGPAVLVPIISESDFIGVLLCARNKGDNSSQFSASDIQLQTAIGEMVGNALQRARLYDQALKRLQHLQTLHSIDMAISSNLDLSVILDVLLNQGMAQLDGDAASILLLNPHTHMLEFAAGIGFRAKEIYSVRMRLGEGLPGSVAMERKVLHIPDISGHDNLVRKYLLDEGFTSYQAAPLIAKGQLQGVIEIFNRQPLPVGEEKTGFLETLATQAGIAIDNSQLFSDLQRSTFELEMAYDATIEGWSRALDLRDQETEGHTLRVTDMTLQIAQAMGVKGVEIVHIRRGALLHDIGKMGVPDRILLKPDKLDTEEWEIMKKHTVYAFEMLWPIEFLRKAIDIPHCHHERWDGTGYPRQLKEEQIPLSARMFAVADVWDALINDRPYRKAWTEQKALEYITANSGKHFDPRVVEIFLDFLNNKS